jgi:hypothetical protein
MKAKRFDKGLDEGRGVTAALDFESVRRPYQEQRFVNVDFPAWMIDSLDSEAGQLGVTRQPIIKAWCAVRLQKGRRSTRSTSNCRTTRLQS